MHPATAQLAAYNAQDIDAFCACYHDDVRVENGRGELLYQGMAALRERYLALWQRFPQNHAALLSHVELGDWVIDEELVSGRDGAPFRVVAIYRVVGDRIANVRFLSQDD